MAARISLAAISYSIFWIWLGLMAVFFAVLFALHRWRHARPAKKKLSYSMALRHRFAQQQANLLTVCASLLRRLLTALRRGLRGLR